MADYIDRGLAQKRPQRFFVKNLENVQGDERDVIFIVPCKGLMLLANSINALAP